MLLSHETTVRPDDSSANIIGHMCYAASKLWNVCNYERNNYKELGLARYPDWYYQKSAHKANIWYTMTNAWRTRLRGTSSRLSGRRRNTWNGAGAW